jgi:hypothetical protein
VNPPREIKHGVDTRPQNRLPTAKEQHCDVCTILQGASTTLHTIFLEVGGTIYDIIRWRLLRNWVLILNNKVTRMAYSPSLWLMAIGW